MSISQEFEFLIQRVPIFKADLIIGVLILSPIKIRPFPDAPGDFQGLRPSFLFP
jgi:hypothetical protein